MAIPKGGLNDYGIPKAWGGRTVWNSEGKGGLSTLEFPKARGDLDEDAARGRVWKFSGITQFMAQLWVRAWHPVLRKSVHGQI